MLKRLIRPLLLTFVICCQSHAFAAEKSSLGFYATVTLCEGGKIEVNILANDEDGALYQSSGSIQPGAQLYMEFLDKFTGLKQDIPRNLRLAEAKWVLKKLESQRQ